MAYLRLLRPANILTAWADILLGVAIAAQVDPSCFDLGAIGWLLLSTSGLYGGGVVFNDVFDYELDCVERPERPLPSGAATRAGAIALGSGALLIGIGSAWAVHSVSLLIAILVALLAVVYDAYGKHHPFWGPVNMGLCRSFNLLLGISLFPGALAVWWPMGFVPLLFIGAITLISRGEVNGGDRSSVRAAVGLYASVVGITIFLGLHPYYDWRSAVPLTVLFIYMVFPSIWKAHATLSANDIRQAVRAGVTALIVLDAALAAGFSGLPYGFLILGLLPLSLTLAKFFAVT